MPNPSNRHRNQTARQVPPQTSIPKRVHLRSVQPSLRREWQPGQQQNLRQQHHGLDMQGVHQPEQQRHNLQQVHAGTFTPFVQVQSGKVAGRAHERGVPPVQTRVHVLAQAANAFNRAQLLRHEPV